MGEPGSKRERSFCSSFIRPWIERRSTLSRCLLSAARRRASRAADLADDGEDIIVQKQPALLRQKLPTLQKPVLQGDKTLHLRRRDAILPRHATKLSPVVPDSAQKLLARVLAPVEEPTARDKGPDAQQTGEDVRCFEGCERS
jgi:hypothetical protein